MVAPTLALFILMLLMPALVHRAALLGERRARTLRWQGIGLERSEEPRRGYKTAQVLVTPDCESAMLSGITVGGTYGSDDKARCHRPGCTPPATSCECGFYAFKERQDALDLLGQRLACNGLRHKALLEVELDGIVLQYERGYRAQCQRVLGLRFDRRCSRCLDVGADGRAVCLAAAAEFAATPLRRLRPDLPAPPEGLLALRPVCERHIPPGSPTLGLPDVAGLLGTEASWLEPSAR